MYSHDRIADVTHRRARDLFGATSVHYYRHIRAMVRAGRNTTPATHATNDDYLARAPQITTPTLLVTGEDNHVFTDSNNGYGHQDMMCP